MFFCNDSQCKNTSSVAFAFFYLESKRSLTLALLVHFSTFARWSLLIVFIFGIWGKWPILRFIFYIPPGVNVYSCVSSSCVSLFMCLCFFETGNISWQEAASNIDGKSERRWKENNTLIYLVILSSETGNIKVSHENHFLFTRIKRIIWYLS